MTGTHLPGRVGDACLRPAVELGADASVADAARAMVDGGVSAVLIAHDSRHLIVTEHDITRAVADALSAATPAVSVATPHPTAVMVDALVIDAVALMLRMSVRDLPVIDARGAVIGILTLPDGIDAVLAAADLPLWLAGLRFALRIGATESG